MIRFIYSLYYINDINLIHYRFILYSSLVYWLLAFSLHVDDRAPHVVFVQSIAPIVIYEYILNVLLGVCRTFMFVCQ